MRAVKGNKDRDDCQLETLQFVQSKPLLTQQPKNLTTHNLCKGTQPTNLLGLGLKFCLASSKPTQTIKDTMQKLANRIRTKYYLQQNSSTNNNYIPQLYIRLKGWDPPPAPLKVENSITNFEKQLRMVSTPKKSTDFIIMPTDKNLSPAIMNRDEYIKKILLSTF